MIVNAINNIKSSNYFVCKKSNNYCSSYSLKSNNFETYDKAMSVIAFTSAKINKKVAAKLIDTLSPIKSEQEYNEVIKRVCNTKTLQGENFWNFDFENNTYRYTKNEYIGLLPYCGTFDVSYYINCYLGNRIPNSGTYKATEKSLCDIIRALDYSLLKLDEEFGKYEGIVFRKGYFTTKPIQYASGSKSAAIASKFNGFDENENYSIIRVKNGHKICDFQKQMDSFYAKVEAEILIDRHSKHRLIHPSKYDDEIIQAKEEFAKYLGRNFYSEKPPVTIKVYEEV